jgi:membrane protein DedA with SNARE-associated domain
LAPNSRFVWLRRKAPQLIVAALIAIVVAYLIFEISEDVLVNSSSWTSGPVIGAIISLKDDVKATISSWGYAGVFFLMLLESSSLPIPSEVILPFAGFLAFKTELNIVLIIITATIAGVLGSLIDYYIGKKGVNVLAKYKILGHVILSEEQLAFASHWFYKYGSIMVFLGRLVPGFRTFISFPAGAVRMSIAKFVVFTAAGCLIWNSLLVYVGYYLGSNWAEVTAVSHDLIILVIIIIVVSALAYLLIRRKRQKKFNPAV